MDIREFLKKNDINYLLVNSTNEFLVEYNTLEQNSRYKLTGFSGSAGEALVAPETIYLFVDGRYHIQADQEVDHSKVTVVKLQTGQQYIDELLKKIPENETLGVFSKKNSQSKIEKLAQFRKLKFFDNDPFDIGVQIHQEKNVEIPIEYTGKSAQQKIAEITNNMSADEALYITDLDGVSYLFNMRDFVSQPYSAKIKAKAIIMKDSSVLFTQDKLPQLEEFLKHLHHKVYTDKNTINAYDYNLLKGKAVDLKSSPVKQMKAQKNEAEINHLKSAFKRTDNAVRAIREFIENNDNISEYDISQRLEQEFKNQGAIGLSFASIVAKDENAALAHYSKCSKNEILKDGSLVLIDCGAYFEGGLATDITRVFVKGQPNELQKKIYTLVLRAFLNAYNYCKVHTRRPVTGFEIDNFIREFFAANDTEGFVFNHGLGHGIGVNVHEYPPNLSANDFAKVPLLQGECFSIEPGLYKQGAFGVRLENSCYYSDGGIHSFVKMNYEKKLINFDSLTEQEKEWLKEFEVK
ncbi:MAG: M24 family metallopeptidase [Cyanobacteriota bacterium]|nr:M24 family metallopeptidase [Cyanobacteriota bacterium]